jgi:hypothetical protein
VVYTYADNGQLATMTYRGGQSHVGFSYRSISVDVMAGVAAGHVGLRFVVGVDRGFSVDLFGEYAERIDSETLYGVWFGCVLWLRRGWEPGHGDPERVNW